MSSDDPPLCPTHRSELVTLKAKLGRHHRGHKVARRTLAAIARQCPRCLTQETR